LAAISSLRSQATNASITAFRGKPISHNLATEASSLALIAGPAEAAAAAGAPVGDGTAADSKVLSSEAGGTYTHSEMHGSMNFKKVHRREWLNTQA